MKIKNVILLCGLAVAFAAASVWVFLSGGNNAKAVRTKFKLGGLLLTVSSMLSLTGCKGGFFGTTCYDPGPMCYDTVALNYVEFTTADQSGVMKVGGTIGITIKDSPYNDHSFKILTAEQNILQSGKLGETNGSYKVTIGNTEHRGRITIEVYGIDGSDEYFLGSGAFSIE